MSAKLVFVMPNSELRQGKTTLKAPACGWLMHPIRQTTEEVLLEYPSPSTDISAYWAKKSSLRFLPTSGIIGIKGNSPDLQWEMISDHHILDDLEMLSRGQSFKRGDKLFYGFDYERLVFLSTDGEVNTQTYCKMASKFPRKSQVK